MSRNSIEKRSTLAERGWVNRSRCNPESATSIMVSPNLPERFQKFQDSTVSTHNLGVDANSLEVRYETLQKLYKGLKKKIEIQNQNVNDQTKELKRLQNIHENNEKEIKRLRGMLGFLKKQDKQTQTKWVPNYEDLGSPKSQMDNNSIHISKFSNHSSKDNSKIHKTMNTTNYQSQSNIPSPISHKSLPKTANVRVSRSSKYLINQRTSSDLYFKKEERCMSPSGFKQKYKFIPTLPLA